MYTFYCKHCGATASSSNREDVEKARRAHRQLQVNRNACTLLPTTAGTVTRPELVHLIDQREAEKKQ